MPKKILIVDDEPDIIKITRYWLIKQGYEVLIVSNGQEGINAAREHKPDVIVMDYRMPVLNGIDACKILKQDETLKHIPIIFMTASSANITEEMLKQVGVDGYVSKPFDGEELLKKIERFVDKK